MMATKRTWYKGCCIEWSDKLNSFVWEEPDYGMKSEGCLETAAAAKADIDLYFGSAPGPINIHNEMEWC